MTMPLYSEREATEIACSFNSAIMHPYFFQQRVGEDTQLETAQLCQELFSLITVQTKQENVIWHRCHPPDSSLYQPSITNTDL